MAWMHLMIDILKPEHSNRHIVDDLTPVDISFL